MSVVEIAMSGGGNGNGMLSAPTGEIAHAPGPRVYGELLAEMPRDLYIPPDALEIILDSFEGPLDLLLYLIRKANISILDIPMAALTAQYLVYVEAMRTTNLELAAEYLLMAAMLIEIKSRMLLPRPPKPKAQRRKTRALNWCAA